METKGFALTPGQDLETKSIEVTTGQTIETNEAKVPVTVDEETEVTSQEDTKALPGDECSVEIVTETHFDGATPGEEVPHEETALFQEKYSETIQTATPSHKDTEAIGAEVTLHDVSYEIGKNKSRKMILENISCRFPCGLNAILGPTGCGKTSLLDIIAGRKHPSGQKGTILVDGKPRPDYFRRRIGYVVQDDFLYETLTVKENLAFSANLRLGPDISKPKKNELVKKTLHDLGLRNCKDTKVGSIDVRGVSGGERKRTNIGMELVISPKVIFLDEPTTGLDASTAIDLLNTLKTLANAGHTIILSIHQPRYSIFKLFDQMTLLSMGKLTYHGPADESIAYFKDHGYECEEHDNPADFYLDIINKPNATAIGAGQSEAYPNSPSSAVNLEIPATSASKQLERSCEIERANTANTLEEIFKNSQMYYRQKDQLDRIFENSKKISKEKVLFKQKKESFGTQVKYISKRILQNIFRNRSAYITQICVVIVFALLSGGIYFQLDDTIIHGIPNRAGAVFFIVMTETFQNLSAVGVFIRERVVFKHEQSAGFYGCFAYFVSKVSCDIIPMRLQPTLLFSLISYFMIGFQMNAAKFFVYFLTIFLTTLGASSVSFCVSARIKRFEIAYLLVALIFVFMMVFGGTLVKLSSVGWWIRWVSYISIFRYSINALLVNEMENLAFCNYTNGTSYCKPNAHAGNEYLRHQEIDYGSSWDLWKNEVALVTISMCLLLASYVQLRFAKKTT